MGSQALNSGLPSHRSPVAQLVEQAAVNRLVAGSSPARGAKSQKSCKRRFGGFFRCCVSQPVMRVCARHRVGRWDATSIRESGRRERLVPDRPRSVGLGRVFPLRAAPSSSLRRCFSQSRRPPRPPPAFVFLPPSASLAVGLGLLLIASHRRPASCPKSESLKNGKMDGGRIPFSPPLAPPIQAHRRRRAAARSAG